MSSRRRRLGEVATLALLSLCGLGCERAPPGPLTVEEVASPAGSGSAQPRLAVGPGERAILSWLEPRPDDYALRYSQLGADGWSEPETVTAGDDWFVNWADTPSVVPVTAGFWAAHWLRYQPESYFAYDVMAAFSFDGGDSWEEPFVLHQDGTESEHGFVTLFPQEDGVGAVWLDGRNFIIDGVYLYEDADGNKVGTGVHYASFDTSGRRLESVEIDEMACDCCLPDVARAADGPVVAYRDRTTDEVRDIVVRRMVDGRWQETIPLGSDNWYIEGCPINGPAVAASGDDVAVAWFTAANNEPHVRVARSGDAGQTFEEAIELDATGSFGYVDAVMLDSGEAIVSWLRSEGDGVDLVIRRMSANGLSGENQTIAHIDIGRPADFPKMVVAGERLVFAWTDFEGDGTVKTAVADVAR